jgi:L-ectoine synthase
MLVRDLEELEAQGRVVSGETWTSRRLLLAADGMGFSLHDTVMRAGTTTAMRYANHLEAVYCIEGQGVVRDAATGQAHSIRPGTVYALDKHDAHEVTATTELRLVCVFNPPLVGPEVHDADGVYPLLTLDGGGS